MLQKDKNSNCPRFEALRAMIDAECETSCLRHPVVMKYIDIKWRNRGLKCTIFLILMKLFFHTCLMVYTTRVIGVVNSGDEISRTWILLSFALTIKHFSMNYAVAIT